MNYDILVCDQLLSSSLLIQSFISCARHFSYVQFIVRNVICRILGYEVEQKISKRVKVVLNSLLAKK